MQALYTLESIHSKLPKDTSRKDAISFDAFKRLVKQHGTYREFGSVMLMTDSDMRDLLALTAVRQKRPADPGLHEVGQMVFIGHPLDDEALVFVGWSGLGREVPLLDQIQLGAQEKVQILGVVTATPFEVDAFRARHKKSRRFGNWFGRTAALMDEVRKLQDEYGEDEGEGVVGRESEVQAEA